MTYHGHGHGLNTGLLAFANARLDHRGTRRHLSAVEPSNPPTPIPPPGQVWQSTAAIAGLSVLLAAGMQVTGGLDSLNIAISRLIEQGGLSLFAQQIPAWWIWSAALIAAVAIPAALLQTRGQARRILLWLSAVAVTSSWAPVLALAARDPDIAAPWVTVVWSGACALFYASRHRMPCDAPEPSNSL
ncbi:MAG: hypothetical protein ACO3RV_02505 [Luteolibacter sp.]